MESETGGKKSSATDPLTLNVPQIMLGKRSSWADDLQGLLRRFWCLRPSRWWAPIEQYRDQAAMAAWKKDYNESRPHTSLGGLASLEYVAQLLAAYSSGGTLPSGLWGRTQL